MRVAPTAAQTRAGKLARIGYDRFNPDDRLGFALMVEDLGPEVSAGVRYGRTGEPISIEVGPELVAWAHERAGLTRDDYLEKLVGYAASNHIVL